MGVKVDFVDGDSWQGIYLNDKLVLENHRVNVIDLLKLLNDEVVEFYSVVEANLDWLAEEGRLPENLEDVKGTVIT